MHVILIGECPIFQLEGNNEQPWRFNLWQIPTSALLCPYLKKHLLYNCAMNLSILSYSFGSKVIKRGPQRPPAIKNGGAWNVMAVITIELQLMPLYYLNFLRATLPYNFMWHSF